MTCIDLQALQLPFPSPLPHKLRPQHQALDAFVLAIDLLRVSGQADRLDQRALLERLARALDGEVLDQPLQLRRSVPFSFVAAATVFEMVPNLRTLV